VLSERDRVRARGSRFRPGAPRRRASATTHSGRKAGATQGPWHTFEDAQRAIDRVVPYVTTTNELTTAGIDPFASPSITILTYSDLLRHFSAGAAIRPEDLERGIRDCFAAGRACRGFAIAVRRTERKRIGSFWLDTLNIRRETDVTGWSFNALIVLVDETVVYTLAGGQPNIRERELTRNPLGPLQSVGEAIGSKLTR